MKILLTLLITTISFALGHSCSKISKTTFDGKYALDVSKPLCSGTLIFNEDFDELNTEKWQHENTLSGGGNWEFQWYTNNRSNSFVKNGILHIKPTLLSDQFGEDFLERGILNVNGGTTADACTDSTFYGCERQGTSQNILNPIKSARIKTVSSFTFKYGRVEVNAKMPQGDWLWPAIWLMPAHNAYGRWPASGEIDIAETRGNKNYIQNGINIGITQTASALHYGPNDSLDRWETSHFKANNPNGYHFDFNRYQLEWTPDYIKFLINEKEIGHVTPSKEGFWKYGDFDNIAPGTFNPWSSNSKMAPFDQQFYLIINLAVGGISYFPDDANNTDKKPWMNNSPTAMRDFYRDKSKWLKTWNLDKNNGESCSLQVDYVKVWAL